MASPGNESLQSDVPPSKPLKPEASDHAASLSPTPTAPPPPSASTVVGAALLRDYAFHIEPFQTHDIHPHDSALRPPGSGALPSQKIDYSSQEEAVRSLPSPTLQRLRQKSVSGHRPTTQRTLSVDRIPRQTIMKALASRGHGSIGGSAGPAANTNNQGVGVPAPSAWSDLVANQSNNQGSSQNPGPPEGERASV
ncbi:hypothetical protein N7468_004537 [Penicillium chermesinum]|uniref:Uncharacterized protein n=1 Tax=Penicillium chermesinum TaxID=63820 RepID=A0A9W9TTA9_9EURO|nr:uncharacterized protein N7468_004537 [Penicillium chermesinum]KAJ5239918.1 hypothetical protein N7468_004537 [Penicillium chermesinum]